MRLAYLWKEGKCGMKNEMTPEEKRERDKRLGEKTAAKKKRDEEKAQLKQADLQRYNSAYKNILWIDDMDVNQAGNETSETMKKIKWMRDYLKEPESLYHIEQVNLFRDAVKCITDNPQYDLVIFDIDMEDGFKRTGDKSNEAEANRPDDPVDLKQTFEKYHIRFDYAKVSSDGSDTAGIYLYLLLLSVGYPVSRMIVYTGNGEAPLQNTPLKDYLNFDMKKEAQAYGVEPASNQNVFDKKTCKLDIESYFTGTENSYYRIRRLVFQACEYWRNRYTKDEEIPFNQLYYSKGGMRQKEMFIGLLDHIEMLFPVRKPEDPEKVYYQAMRIAASFHEKSADIKSISPDIHPYHSCVRNFRNWTSHLKLKNAKEQQMNGEQFALLFCLAMRTYFDAAQVTDPTTGQTLASMKNPPKKNTGYTIYDSLFSYEERYRFDTGYETPDEKQLTKLIKPVFSELMKELSVIKKNNSSILLRDAILDYGSLPDTIMDQRHLFFSLWFYDTEAACSFAQSPDDTITLSYTINTSSFMDICKKAKKENTDAPAVFMQYCFRWLKDT